MTEEEMKEYEFGEGALAKAAAEDLAMAATTLASTTGHVGFYLNGSQRSVLSDVMQIGWDGNWVEYNSEKAGLAFSALEHRPGGTYQPTAIYYDCACDKTGREKTCPAKIAMGLTLARWNTAVGWRLGHTTWNDEGPKDKPFEEQAPKYVGNL